MGEIINGIQYTPHIKPKLVDIRFKGPDLRFFSFGLLLSEALRCVCRIPVCTSLHFTSAVFHHLVIENCLKNILRYLLFGSLADHFMKRVLIVFTHKLVLTYVLVCGGCCNKNTTDWVA